MSDGGDGGQGGGGDFGGIADITGGGGGGEQQQQQQGGGGEGGGGEQQQQQGGGADPEWLASFSADPFGTESSNRDWLKAKGFKDLDGIVKAYRDTEKAVRDGGRIKVPGEGASAEEISAFNKAIGVPDDAKDYEIKAPTGADGKAIALNTPLLDRLSGAAHAAGIPKAAFEATVGEFIKAQMDEAAADTQRLNDEAAAKIAEWGPQSAAKSDAVNKAARALGLTGQDLTGMRQALGSGRTLDLMARLGEGMAEDILQNGNSGQNRFGVSGAEAQKELDRLKLDTDFQKAVMVKGSPERQRWDRLKAAVAADMDRQQNSAAA